MNMSLCSSLEEERDSDPISKQGEMAKDDDSIIVDAATAILSAIPGEDPGRDGLVKTPQRFASALRSFTKGYSQTPEQVLAGALFTIDVAAAKEMIILKDIDVYSLCEHHLVPFFGKCHIAYFPSLHENSKVVGISKLPRLVDLFAQRLQVQERLTHEIMSAIDDLLQPRGVAVILQCRHMCMEMRGVQKSSVETITQAKSGMFRDDHSIWSDLLLSLNFPGLSKGFSESTPHHDVTTQCAMQLSQSATSTVTATGILTPRHASTMESLVSKRIHCTRSPETDADDYRLYQSCAVDEFTLIASMIKDAVKGPMTENRDKFSLLDVGAGNGILLESLCTSPGPLVEYYESYEENSRLFSELKQVAACNGFGENNSNIRGETFPPTRGVERFFDVVLLSHVLYGAENKAYFVTEALRYVKPGGVLLVFHRFETGGSLENLCAWLQKRQMLYDLRIFEASLDLSNLTEHQKSRLSTYTKFNLGAVHSNHVRRSFGCLAIEPHACDLQDKNWNTHVLEHTRQMVSHEARTKSPAAVIRPNTLIGIRSCLRAASIQSVGCGKIAVIGGGHSGNCFANDAICVDMGLWNHVVVDKANGMVRAGGGANIGMITKECEKYGLVVPLGDRPGVGMGLVLQGGLNHLMRSRGLACDNIISLLYVDPDGGLFRAEQQKDLFPFRGAGTNFGVVLEVTLRAHNLDAVTVQDFRFRFDCESFDYHIISRYSESATSLPESACLDGYIYWSGHDQLSFASSLFDTSGKEGPTHENIIFRRLEDTVASFVSTSRSEKQLYSPSQLFDRELYMTDDFSAEKVLSPGDKCPKKLQSLKRCLFFHALDHEVSSLLGRAVASAPTKWSYIHLLHGGGLAQKTTLEESAFGCRNWEFAAVITGRYDCADDTSEPIEAWLSGVVASLQPFVAGVYASDLGPAHEDYALRAFGHNALRLANMKRARDPLNILSCGVPLAGGSKLLLTLDPRLFNGGVVVIFSGRRFSGKDWLAGIARDTLSELLGCEEVITTASISERFKDEFAGANPGINADRLRSDREYKERHRKDLCDYYAMKKAQSPSYDAKCLVEAVEKCDSKILLLTGLRDGLDYARRLAGRVVVLVKVVSDSDAKSARGWTPCVEIDNSKEECASDSKEVHWDLVYDNGVSSTHQSAMAWTKLRLAPAIVKASIRCLPDTPKQGVVYKDLTGNLLLQPFGLSLCTSLILDWLLSNNTAVDAILAPESSGLIFAAPLATKLRKPLILARKAGRLLGDKVSTQYKGSNIQDLSNECNHAHEIEIISGTVRPGQEILIVDDCLASGSTALALAHLTRHQGGRPKKLACVMELVNLKGRDRLESLGVNVFSITQFPGR